MFYQLPGHPTLKINCHTEGQTFKGLQIQAKDVIQLTVMGTPWKLLVIAFIYSSELSKIWYPGRKTHPSLSPITLCVNFIKLMAIIIYFFIYR